MARHRLDVFTPRLPPRSTWSDPQVLKRIVAGGNAAVAAVAAAGNDIVLEVVVRREPGASFVLDDLFARLANFEVLVVYLRCSLQSAMRREAARSKATNSLVQRDYGNIEDECFDVAIDTDALSVAEQVNQLRHALSVGPTDGLARLRTNLQRRAQSMNWDSLGDY